MESERIVCFVDGFNMYHALKQLQQPHLKWLDLQLLFSRADSLKIASDHTNVILLCIPYLETRLVL